MTRTGGLVARVATVGELSAEDFARWRRLEARALEPYPYLSADYLEPASATWAAGAGVRLLLVGGADEFFLVMPFAVERLHPKAPVRMLTTLEPVMADESVRWYPLVDADRGGEALRVAFSSLRSLGLPTLVEIAGIPQDGPLLALLRSVVAPSRVLVRGRSQLAFARFDPAAAPADPDAVDVEPHHRSTSSRKQARQRRRAFERILGAEIALRDRSDDPAVIDDFLELQSAGWKGDADKHGLAYRLTGREAWFRDVAVRAQAAGRFFAFELHAADRPVYIAVGLMSGSTAFGLQDAYDEAGAAQSIGNLGRTALTNWLAGRGHDAFDPNMFWSYVEAGRLFADHREQLRVLVAASGPVSLVEVRTLSTVMRVREAVKRLAERLRRS